MAKNDKAVYIAPVPPTIPSAGDDLGCCLDGWVSSEDTKDTTIGTNPIDGVGARLGDKYDCEN